MNAPRSSPLTSWLVIVVLTVLVVVADLFTWSLFSAVCGIRENTPPDQLETTLCVVNTPTRWVLLPLAGAAVAVIAALAALRSANSRVLMSGLATGLLCAAAIWATAMVEAS